MGESFPARIHVLLAREAKTAVVIRRGPAKAVCTLGWDRQTDEFQLGQWLRGRIYERRADLSPDGKYLIYFAMNGRWEEEARGAWTAVSRAPYLKAVVLYPKGDCWNGGGLFTGRDQFWLNGGGEAAGAAEFSGLRRDRQFVPQGGVGNECLGVYYPRLLRDGWVQTEGRDCFEKSLPLGWRLRKLAHASLPRRRGRGCYWDEHVLVGPGGGMVVDKGDWEWADVDGEDLVWAAGGRIYRGRVGAEGLREERVLVDLNGMEFQAVAAPY